MKLRLSWNSMSKSCPNLLQQNKLQHSLDVCPKQISTKTFLLDRMKGLQQVRCTCFSNLYLIAILVKLLARSSKGNVWGAPGLQNTTKNLDNWRQTSWKRIEYASTRQNLITGKELSTSPSVQTVMHRLCSCTNLYAHLLRTLLIVCTANSNCKVASFCARAALSTTSTTCDPLLC